MGYTLIIGIPNDKNVIKIIKHKKALIFGEVTDQENQRRPSYTARSDFCKFFDITDLMDDILYPHPGLNRLTKKQKDKIKKIYIQNKDKYTPQYDSTDGDAFMVRLWWLNYWISYFDTKYGEVWMQNW